MWDELRKRHLFQIALVYLGAGWLCVEITDFIVGNYGFSNKILDTVVFLAVLGFPAFLVIGWFHGERGPQRVRRAERWLLLTLGSLAAIGTYRIATAEETPAESAARRVDAPNPESDARLTSAGELPDLGARSLAVLPFKNNVSDQDLAWLGAGLADLLTTNFAQVPDMTVVGRQALYDLLTEDGRSEDDEIPEALAMTVARGAGARMLLWGSVTGSAEDMRIDAQVIDVQDGTVMYAADVRGSDVFALVDSLTQRLAEDLSGAAPPPMIRISEVGTRNMDALRAFQAGRAAESAGKLVEAEQHFARAAEIDTSFVLPVARLAARGDAAEWMQSSFDWVHIAPEDLDPEDVEIEELGRAWAAGVVSDEDFQVIVRVGGFDEDDLEEARRIREEHAQRMSTMHSRALRMLERLPGDLKIELEGMTEDQILAHLNTVMGQVRSSVRGLVPDPPRDSLGRPIPPPDGGRGGRRDRGGRD